MENVLYMLAPAKGAQMNSFIIRTSDEKIIVIDGGYRNDAEKLLCKLKEITGEEKPHIDGWFLSHAHADHIEAFMELVENYEGKFSFDKVYYCFPSFQYFEKYESDCAYTVAEFYTLLPKFAEKACTITQDDRYEIGSAAFDILYTADPAFKNNAVNNSSTVFRMTLCGQTVLFLGDAGIEAGRKLLTMYKDKLKSDYCQMAHHGQNGVEREVYAAIAPRAALWCTPQWLWDNNVGKGYNTHIFKTVIVREWMNELGVKENYVIKDGDQRIEF